MHFLKQLLKKILFGRKTRSRRIWLGLSAGLNFQIDPANKTQRLLGLDEWEIAPFMRHFLSCSKSFVDIGSSDGFYALTALRLNPEIQIVACDSEPALEKLFKENLQINPLLPQQSITWHVAMAGSAGITLDTLSADLPTPVFVKIDVEGGELDVLQSAPQLFEKNAADFLIETHSLELEERIIGLFTDSGYTTEIIRPAWWRRLLPEQRPLIHNRWLIASRKSGMPD